MAYTTIDDPSAHFQVKTYSGNQASSQAITNDGNSNLQPDWLWIKNRSGTDSHLLQDSSRGQNASSRYKYLITNATSAEGSQTDNDSVHSLDSNGFTVGFTNSSGWNDSYNYVAWQWKANGGTTSSNTDGSITSTVQVNQDAGFSIVTYTGNGTVADSNTNVGHGLSQKPDLIFIKDRDASVNWNMWHKDFATNNVIYPNLSNAKNTDANVWANSAFTSSIFYVGNGEVNSSGNDYVAYCFAGKQGYSKFGTYVGNGAGEKGPSVYTGFKPAFVWIKLLTSSQSWDAHDIARNPFNPMEKRILTNSSGAEETRPTSGGNVDCMDFLSNGFKIRSVESILNTAGSSYIYMAFAENPFVTSTGIPTTAR